jgi:hypothetical protein
LDAILYMIVQMGSRTTKQLQIVNTAEVGTDPFPQFTKLAPRASLHDMGEITLP